MGEPTLVTPRLNGVEPLEEISTESTLTYACPNQGCLKLGTKSSNKMYPILKGSIDSKYRQIYKSKSKRQMRELKNFLNSNLARPEEIADRFHSFSLTEIEIINQYLKAKQRKKEFSKEEEEKLVVLVMEFGLSYKKLAEAFPNRCFRDLKQRYYKLIHLDDLNYKSATTHSHFQCMKYPTTMTLLIPQIEFKKPPRNQGRRKKHILASLRIQKATEHFNYLNTTLDQEYVHRFNKLLETLIAKLQEDSRPLDESKIVVDNINEQFRVIQSYYNLKIQDILKKISLPYQRNLEPLSKILLGEMNYILKLKLNLVNLINDLTIPLLPHN